MKLILVLILASISATIASVVEQNTASAVGPTAPYQLALDANPITGSVDSTAVHGPASFDVGLNVTAIGTSRYKAYQWEIEFPTGGLAFDTGSVVDNTASTMLTTCVGPAASASAIPTDTVVGNGVGCASTNQSFTGTTFVGQIATFKMHCAAQGAFPVVLRDLQVDAVFGSTLFDAGGAVLDSGTTGITVICT
jgi:hypothetical protein